MKRKNNEIKAVFRFSDPYEKLDYIENNINDIIPVIEKTDIEYRDINIQKLQRNQDIFDRHHGLLLYARKNHGFDLDKILDQWYYDREYKKEEIKKAYDSK